ncbi:MAG: penicillin acylase family protein [Candidatus Odinarchaeota archaeon]
MSEPKKPRIGRFIVSALFTVAIVMVFAVEVGPFPPIGALIDPHGGLWQVPGNSELSDGTYIVDGIDNEISIIRDEWGVPHIFAQTDADAYFGIGYCHAQDRLWQLDIQRRQFSGTLAEILGPVAVPADKLFRSIGLARVARETWDYFKTHNSTEGFVQALEAYADGINAYLDDLAPKDYPREFKLLNYKPTRWYPEDSIAWGNMMAWGLTGDFIFYELYLAIAEFYLGRSIVNELLPVNNTFNMIPVLPNYGSYSMMTGASSFSETKDSFTEKLVASQEDSRSLSAEMIPVVESVLKTFESLKEINVLGLSLSEFNPGQVGSNNWVINGSKSETGYPVLANDMHLSHGLPALWYEVHYSSAESGMNVYGFSFAGSPGVVAGHNDYCAWGFTNAQVDVTDTYFYLTNTDGTKFWNETKNSYEDFITVNETIKVKNSNNVVLTVRFTLHGGTKCPVIPSEAYISEEISTLYPGVISMRWTGLDIPNNLVAASYRYTRMKSLDDFKEAGKLWDVPGQNAVYADIYGNIALRPVAKYPIRPTDYWGRVPSNGSAGEGEWLGYIPYDELAVTENPEQGYLASTNQKIAGPDYPYFYGSFVADGYRSRRINEILNGTGSGTGGTFTVEDIAAAQADNLDLCARALVPTATSITPETDETLVIQAVNVLKQWNHSMDSDLVAPTIWWIWLAYYTDYIVTDELKEAGMDSDIFPSPQFNTIENFTIHNASVTWFDNVTTNETVETISDIALAAMRDAVKNLAQYMGSDVEKWYWGDFHKLEIKHLSGIKPFNAPLYRWEGDELTLNAASGLTRVRSGPSERVVYDLAKLKRRTIDGEDVPAIAQTSIPGGQRGWPLSKHYMDQLEELWLQYKYHDAWFTKTKDDLLSITATGFMVESVIVLKPRGGT